LFCQPSIYRSNSDRLKIHGRRLIFEYQVHFFPECLSAVTCSFAISNISTWAEQHSGFWHVLGRFPFRISAWTNVLTEVGHDLFSYHPGMFWGETLRQCTVTSPKCFWNSLFIVIRSLLSKLCNKHNRRKGIKVWL
jgi:hypothetical protein